MGFDRDAFEERAAIMEHDGGLTRFRAETAAAAAQGVSRWEAIGDVARRVVEAARDQRSALARQASADNLPAMQRQPEKEG